jgi:hypothetical protein
VRQPAKLLFPRAPRPQCRAGQIQADAVDQLGCPAAAVFEIDQRDVERAGPAAAFLLRPVDGDPTMVGECLLPSTSEVDLCFDRVEGFGHDEMCLEPFAEFQGECAFGGRKSEVHRCLSSPLR